MSDQATGLAEQFSDCIEESDFEKVSAGNGQQFNKVFFERPSEEHDKVMLGRTLFDLKEYRKCAHTLQNIPVSNQSALFLKNFATFLVCE
jgi:hypothetical protein